MLEEIPPKTKPQNQLVTEIEYSGFLVKKIKDGWFAVPKFLEDWDPEDSINEAHPSIIEASDTFEIKRLIDLQMTTCGIEFFGWSPAFEVFGNCGTHPQFGHRQHPPKGWHYCVSAPLRRRSEAFIWADTLDEIVEKVLGANSLKEKFSWDTSGINDQNVYIGEFTKFTQLKISGNAQNGYSYGFFENQIFNALFFGVTKTSPELVDTMYSGANYNIILCSGLYFGHRQGQGAFSLNKLVDGGYDWPVFISKTLDELRIMIADGKEGQSCPIRVGKSSTFHGLDIYHSDHRYIAIHKKLAESCEDLKGKGKSSAESLFQNKTTLSSNLDKAISSGELVDTMFSGANYNIILCSGLYFGYREGQGAFSLTKLADGGYDWPVFISKTLDELRIMIADGKEGQNCPIRVGKSSTFRGLDIYHSGNRYIAIHKKLAESCEDLKGEEKGKGKSSAESLFQNKTTLSSNLDKAILSGEWGLEADNLETLVEKCIKYSWIELEDKKHPLSVFNHAEEKDDSWGLEADNLETLMGKCIKYGWIELEDKKHPLSVFKFEVSQKKLECNAGKKYDSLDLLVSEVFDLLNLNVPKNSRNRSEIIFENLLGKGAKVCALGGAYFVPKHSTDEFFSSQVIPYEFTAKNQFAGQLFKTKIFLNLVSSVVDLFIQSLFRGGRIKDFIYFLKTRNKTAQQLLYTNADVVFVPSVPFIVNQYPWVIELEDVTSFFFPFFHNGKTKDVLPTDTPYFPMLKALIESPACRAIIAHVKTTAEGIPKVFGNPQLEQKVFFVPVGVNTPDLLPRTTPDGNINIIFTGSWNQSPQNFFLRGGLDTLYAFEKIAHLNHQANLILRSPIPDGEPKKVITNLMEKYPNQIKIYSEYMEKDEWHQFLCNADIFILPSARIHVVSILEAMSFGLPVIVSDGWGISDYVDDGRTGILIPGRYGTVSWYDEKTGMLREDYEPMYTSDPNIVEGLVEEIEKLINHPNERERLGMEARREVKERFNFENWNRALKLVLDKTV